VLTHTVQGARSSSSRCNVTSFVSHADREYLWKKVPERRAICIRSVCDCQSSYDWRAALGIVADEFLIRVGQIQSVPESGQA